MSGGDEGETASLRERAAASKSTEADWLAFREAPLPDTDVAARGGLPSRRRSNRWIGVLALGAFTALALLISTDAVVAMRMNDACPLPTHEFDVVETDTVAVSWFPPRVQCRYVVETSPEQADRLRDGRPVYDDTAWESRWRVLLPIPFVAAWMAVIRARRRRRPAEPTGQS